MKKFLIAALIVFTAAGSASAGWGGSGQGPSSHGLPEAGDSGSDLAAITISGTLEIINGQLAVKSGFNTYFVKGLSRLMRSVFGLTAGAKVTLEGYSSVIMGDGVAAGSYFKADKLTFNGQTYTLAY
jgi:hypothetical protein